MFFVIILIFIASLWVCVGTPLIIAYTTHPNAVGKTWGISRDLTDSEIKHLTQKEY